MSFDSGTSEGAGEATSLVLPVYNAAAAVDCTWSLLAKFLERAPTPMEVIFVCDGCTDDTFARLQSAVRGRSSQVTVLTYPKNRGKGYAVRTGLAAATGAYRLFTDFDLSYRFEDVEEVIARLRAGDPMVIASRSHQRSEVVMPIQHLGHAFRRHVQGRIFNRLVRTLLPISNGDTQAGLKGMRAEVAERILPHLSIDGFGVDCELLTACARFGIPVAEVPVRVAHRDTQSTVNAAATWVMVRDLMRIRQAWKDGPPPPQPLALSDWPRELPRAA